MFPFPEGYFLPSRVAAVMGGHVKIHRGLRKSPVVWRTVPVLRLCFRKGYSAGYMMFCMCDVGRVGVQSM